MEPKGILIQKKVVPTATYLEAGTEPIPKVFLEDLEYGRGLQRFIGVCTDIVIVNSARREIFLARRRAKPMTGWWYLGGGQVVNETHVEAAIRNFARETDIRLSPEQLDYHSCFDYFWKDRQQEPQTIGCHMESHTFTVELSDEQIASIHLEPNEFETDKGLTAFTREKLVEEGVFQSIIDIYDLIFPPPQVVACGKMEIVSKDERRTIRELNTDRSSLQLFEVHTADLPLGRHAHGNKSEAFTILEGGGFVLTCAVDAAGNKIGEVARYELQEGSAIEIPAFTAHTFYLNPGTRMHCRSSMPYDATDFLHTPFLTR